MSNEIAPPSNTPISKGFSIRRSVPSVYAKCDGWVRSLSLRIRPRVSLLTGSVFVLVTLLLPMAYGSCGGRYTGYEFIHDRTLIWPGAMAFSLPYGDWSLYALAVGF